MDNEIEIRSEIAGTLLRFVAAPYTPLAAGDEILIMDSMKMEIPVHAPVAGCVTSFLFEEGVTVDEDVVIAKFLAS
ncbi:acetyl-CoA carboxylase biotin carboxyl carrier protein subunit [Herbaspirillum lusitanum]|uniref:acetyl-CoA carboxylase biotin carboxyl carrier protein subunit n=1 Tax=Herbaspirillum lusitanum TaxID=213312 RepID=UPI00037D1552|nr:acetyl-CoA carboxylase biotin carboxyl carrier protein subunit [Herbaspirillum lusitanum]